MDNTDQTPTLRRRLIAGCTWLLLAFIQSALAEFQPEPVGKIETLPAAYPDHWVMVHDFSFFHMMEGEVLVVDPLAENQASQYKGMMTASFIAAYQRARERNEHYVIETFYSRGTRGGERTDVVTIYAPDTLAVSGEVVIPSKRITGMPKQIATGLINGERFLGVYNFTPAQSVSIVDLENRQFVGEVTTAGCAFVLPNGVRSFTSICANGTFLTSHLNADGTLKDASRSAVAFDANNDPIFEGAAISGGVAYFPTFTGQVLPVDISRDEIAVEDKWWLTTTDERNWRPGGMNVATVDAAGAGYFLMNPDGGEGTHKDGGAEVWVYDLDQGERTARITLTNWGLSLGTTGTGDGRLLLVTNAEMGVDVYRLPGGEFVQTLDTGAATPFMVHGAN
ncbi:MAG: amine dehydrogenase large subunit [Pseudomonadota bacterium]